MEDKRLGNDIEGLFYVEFKDDQALFVFRFFHGMESFLGEEKKVCRVSPLNKSSLEGEISL